MVFIHRMPRLLRWVLSVALLLLVCMTLGRVIFYFTYNPPGKAFSGSAFLMGLRFDARISAITVLVILVVCALPFFNPFKKKAAARFWNIALPVLFVLLLFFYVIDFFHYDYLHQRLNATVLNYLQDAGISYKMMWQTYPVVKVSLFLIVLIFVSVWFFKKWLLYFMHRPAYDNKKNIGFYSITILLLAQVSTALERCFYFE
jgi:hypothetical protein